MRIIQVPLTLLGSSLLLVLLLVVVVLVREAESFSPPSSSSQPYYLNPRRSSSWQQRVSSSSVLLVLHSAATTTASASTNSFDLGDGLIKTITRSGTGPLVNLGDVATVRYTCYHDDNAVFSRSSSQKVIVGDGTMIQGWDKALRTMRVGEVSLVHVPSDLAYGETGIPPILPPNASIQLELHVLDSQSPTANIDFDSLAMADKTPRTASEIAAAFEARQAAKALVQGPAKEGFEGWIEKAKNFYFFGLFEGETGERPPWFLRPSITFPLAFLFVGAAFYITFAGGAIYERGAQIKDELDEFIVSYDSNNNNAVGGNDGPQPSAGVLLALAMLLLNNPSH